MALSVSSDGRGGLPVLFSRSVARFISSLVVIEIAQGNPILQGWEESRILLSALVLVFSVEEEPRREEVVSRVA